MTRVEELRARVAWDWKVSVLWTGPDGEPRRRHVLARYCWNPELAIAFARRILRPHELDILEVVRRRPRGALEKRQSWRQIRDLLIIAESAWRAPRHPWERLLAGCVRGEPGFLSWRGHYRAAEQHPSTWQYSRVEGGSKCPSCEAPLLRRSFPAGPYHHGNPETLCLLCGQWTKRRWVRYGHDTHEIRHRGQRVTWKDPEEKGKETEVEKTITPDPEWVPAAEWRPASHLEGAAWSRLIERRLSDNGPRESWWPLRTC